MVMGGCGFESQHCILDGNDIFQIDLLLKLYILMVKTENKCKRGRGRPIFKMYKNFIK